MSWVFCGAVQLKNEGNSNVEAANQPGVSSVFGDYPEILGPALDRDLPEGRLADYQPHKVRVYGTYTQKMGRFGAIASRCSSRSSRG